MYIYMKLCVIC